MSASAVVGPEHAGPGATRTLLKFPDFLVLALALPVFIMADWPLAGWGGATIAWLIQAVVVTLMQQKAAASTEVRHQVGFVVGSSLMRAWIAAAVILPTGLIFGDAAGLSCALLTILLFTVYFLNKLLVHYFSTTDKA